MKTLRKYFSVLLCLCMATYTSPVFAFTVVKADFVKVELSDAQLDQAVGGSGSVDATLADYSTGAASAVFANRSTLYCTYRLSTIDSNGNVLEIMKTGDLAPGQAIVVSGTPTSPDQKYVQARIWNNGLPGIESKDASFGASW